MSEIDNLDLNLDLDEAEKENRTEERVKKILSDKDQAIKDREAEAEARKKAEEDALAARKEVDFYKNFSSLAPKYQNSTEFQDKIKEKVTSGYDVEDAIVAVLNKEGKYVAPTVAEASVNVGSPAGGSAVNAINSGAEKPVTEMNKEEIKAKLMEPDIARDLEHLLGRS